MGGSFRQRGRRYSLESLVMAAACALTMTACASTSYQEAALEASDRGDQKTATSLARKEVARFSTSDQCSRSTRVNCGTLALAYGTLARYQILDGDRTGGEDSFRSAKQALGLTDLENRASATAAVYGDVSEAFWKAGDRARAVDVFKEGRTAGADQYLYMTSAARFVEQQQQQQPSTVPPDSPQVLPAATRPSAQATTRTVSTGSGSLQPTPLQPTPLQPTR